MKIWGWNLVQLTNVFTVFIIIIDIFVFVFLSFSLKSLLFYAFYRLSVCSSMSRRMNCQSLCVCLYTNLPWQQGYKCWQLSQAQTNKNTIRKRDWSWILLFFFLKWKSLTTHSLLNSYWIISIAFCMFKFVQLISLKHWHV